MTNRRKGEKDERRRIKAEEDFTIFSFTKKNQSTREKSSEVCIYLEAEKFPFHEMKGEKEEEGKGEGSFQEKREERELKGKRQKKFLSKN